jgi:hypothetical protein
LELQKEKGFKLKYQNQIWLPIRGSFQTVQNVLVYIATAMNQKVLGNLNTEQQKNVFRFIELVQPSQNNVLSLLKESIETELEKNLKNEKLEYKKIMDFITGKDESDLRDLENLINTLNVNYDTAKVEIYKAKIAHIVEKTFINTTTGLLPLSKVAGGYTQSLLKTALLQMKVENDSPKQIDQVMETLCEEVKKKLQEEKEISDAKKKWETKNVDDLLIAVNSYLALSQQRLKKSRKTF